MAETVCYRLYSASLGPGNQNVATLGIVRPGRIVACVIGVSIINGASTGHLHVEVTKNVPAGGSVGLLQVNNPQRQLLVATVAIALGTSLPNTVNQLLDNLSFPVAIGDALNLGSQLLTGSAPTTCYGWANIYVVE